MHVLRKGFRLFTQSGHLFVLSLSNQLPYNKQTLPWQAGNKPLCEESVRSEGVAAPKTRSRVPPCVSTAARRAAPRWPACKLTGPGDTAPVGSSKREEITCREQNGGPAERQLRMQCISYAACAFTICENSGSTASQGTHHFFAKVSGSLPRLGKKAVEGLGVHAGQHEAVVTAPRPWPP